MRFLFLICITSLALFASDTVEFFNKSAENKVLCRVGQYSYKVVSQKNAVIESMHEHQFFKLKDENLYFLTTGCQELDGQKPHIMF